MCELLSSSRQASPTGNADGDVVPNRAVAFPASPDRDAAAERLDEHVVLGRTARVGDVHLRSHLRLLDLVNFDDLPAVHPRQPG